MNLFFTIQLMLKFKRWKIYIISLIFVLYVILIKWYIITFTNV